MKNYNTNLDTIDESNIIVDYVATNCLSYNTQLEVSESIQNLFASNSDTDTLKTLYTMMIPHYQKCLQLCDLPLLMPPYL